MQLTCSGITRNFSKLRLQGSLLKIVILLYRCCKIVQQVATRCKQQRQWKCKCVYFYYPNNKQIQTATFQTNGLRSVHRYVQNTCTPKYNLDIRILICTPVLGRLILHWQSPYVEIILVTFGDFCSNISTTYVAIVFGILGNIVLKFMTLHQNPKFCAQNYVFPFSFAEVRSFSNRIASASHFAVCNAS